MAATRCYLRMYTSLTAKRALCPTADCTSTAHGTSTTTCSAAREYRVVSTPDLRTWTDHGVSFDVANVAWTGTAEARRWPGLDWSRPTPYMRRLFPSIEDRPPPTGGLLFAPDAVHRDGRYYLYFCGSDDSEGVAIANRPEGPFNGASQLPCSGIDPAVFIDDDGQAYYYWGQFAANGAKLAPDMTAFVPGSEVYGLLTEEEHYFHEGTSISESGRHVLRPVREH